MVALDIRRPFETSPIQQTRNLESAGWSRAELSRLTSRGLIKRLRRGVYCLPDYRQNEDGDLLIVAKRNPLALMCLLTALRLHHLTTQMVSEIWLGLPSKARVPRLEYPALRVIRFSPASLAWGVETRLIEGIPLRITNIERVDMTAGEAVEVGAAVNNAQNDEGILRRQARSAWRGLDF